MKQYKILLVFLAGLLSINGIAQTPGLNRQKYDTYRQNWDFFRIRGDTEPGQGLMGSIRNASGPNGSVVLKSGDGGIMQGWYIGVLATEYARLLQEGAPQSTINNTLNELYCALSALERLDKIATSRYNWQTSPPVIDPNIDGVSVRTDMWNDYKPSNFGLLNGNGILDTPVTCNNNHWPVVTEFEKNFYSNQHQNGKDLYRVFFSQDQLYHVLMGLYLTYRYIPDNLFYIDGDCSNGQYVNLREKAKSIALVYIDKVVDEGFFLVDPMNNNLQNEEGGQAHTFSMPLKSLSLLFNGPNYGVGGTDVYWYGSSGFFHEIATRHMSLVMCAITNESFDLSYSAATVIEQHADKVFTHYYFDDYEVRWGNFYRLLHNNLHGGSPLELNFY